jgi:hypothetical protein
MSNLIRQRLRIQSIWQRCWQWLLLGSRQDPLRFVEMIMLLLALLIISLMIVGVCQAWPFWVLSLSYALGAACAALVRESLFPSPLAVWVRVSAIILLATSGYGFWELSHYR